MTKKKAPAPLPTATGAEDLPTVTRTPLVRVAQGAKAPQALSPSVARAIKDIERVRRAIEPSRAVARVIEDAERLRRIVEPPGTEHVRAALRRIEEWHEYILLSDSSTPEEKLEAARYIAECLPPPTTSRNPAAKRKARMLASTAGHRDAEQAAEWSRRELLAPALVRAAEEKDTPQPIRLGRRWAGGSRGPVKPAELRLRWLSVWLRQRALRIVEETLSEKPRKQARTVTLNEADAGVPGFTGELTLDEINLLRVVEREGCSDTLASLAKKITRA